MVHGPGPAAVVFVAEIPTLRDGPPDEIAGYVALTDEGETLCIRQLLVAPAHDDCGIDRQLCAWAEGYAISRGFLSLRAAVGEAELHERVFFRERGFPTYGYSPILMNITDEARRHGNDERVFLKDYVEAIAIMDQVVREYAFFPPAQKSSPLRAGM